MLMQHVIDVRQPCAGTNRRSPVRIDRNSVESAEIEQQTLGRGAPREAVPTAPGDSAHTGGLCESDRAGHVSG